MKRATPSRLEELARELASLPALDTTALKARWKTLYGTEPPKRIGRSLLVRAVAYRLQEEVLGGLKPATRRWLQQVAADLAAGKAAVRSTARKIMPGTRLLREWQGITHEVLIAEDGVLFRGERYRSLSEVARAITGSRWSGPLFFGLKMKAKEATRAAR